MANKKRKQCSGSTANSFQVSDLVLTKKLFHSEMPREAICTVQAAPKSNVYYVLINEPNYGYVLKPNLCYTIKLISYSNWQMQVDGYRSRSGENVKISTCFGYNSLIKFVNNADGAASFKKDQELVKSELADRYGHFLSFSEGNLILGQSILLRMKIDKAAMTHYKLVLEYLLKSSTQSGAHQQIDQNLIQSAHDSDSFIARDTVYSALNRRMDTIFDTIQIAAGEVVLVCGASNCGKSSLAHHMINRYVSRAADQSVLYLECDPGQTEFTPCGILSLVTIDQQILSPPGFKFISSKRSGLFTEPGRIVSKIFGAITPTGYCPEYIDLIKQLLDDAKLQQQKTRMPLFVNTMGWIEELGLELLSILVNLVRPSHIIRIQSNNENFINNLNCIQNLSSLNSKNPNLPDDVSLLLTLRKTVGFRLWYTSTCVSDTFRKSFYRTAALRREINQLAYLATTLWPDISFVPFHSICAVKLPLSSLFVHCIRNPQICPDSIYDLLNASWVILGNINEADAFTLQASSKPRFRQSNSMKLIQKSPKSAIGLGCGVVRTIDLQEQCLHIVMPRVLCNPAESGTEFPSTADAAVNLIVLPDRIAIPSGLLNEQFLYQGASILPYIFSYFEPK